MERRGEGGGGRGERGWSGRGRRRERERGRGEVEGQETLFKREEGSLSLGAHLEVTEAVVLALLRSKAGEFCSDEGHGELFTLALRL